MAYVHTFRLLCTSAHTLMNNVFCCSMPKYNMLFIDISPITDSL